MSVKDSTKINVTLGFDLGIGSVGWSIVQNDNNEILELGSRLFNEPKLAKTRRDNRAIRRSIRRKNYKKLQFKKIVLKYKELFGLGLNSVSKDIDDIYLEMSQKYPNIIYLRAKALEQEINSKELIWILHDYLQNRGFFYEVVEEDTDKKGEASVISLNKAAYNFPTQFQKAFYDKYHWYNGVESFANVKFSHKDYKKELNHLFSIQAAKYEESKFKEFQQEFFKLYDWIRNYETGPGSEHSYSPYGIYEYDENHKLVKKYNYIWEKTMGKCSIFANEYCAAKQSLGMEIFNLLEDLNNIRHNKDDDWKLSFENKKAILSKWIEKAKDSKKIPTLNYKTVLEYLKAERSDIKELLHVEDFRNSDKKISELESLFEFISIFKNNKANLSILNFDTLFEFIKSLDLIFDVLVKNKEIEKRTDIIKDKYLEIFNKYFNSEEDINNAILDISRSSKLKTTKTHSLSLKVINLVLDDLLNENTNLNKLKFDKNSKLYFAIQEYNKSTQGNEQFLKQQPSKYMDSSFLNDLVVPPAFKTAMAEAIKVFNQIIKEYGNIYNISKIGLEMPRDKNSKEEIDKINKQNKDNRARYEKIKTRVCEISGDIIDINKLNLKTKQKLLLYCQQDGYDPYKNEKLDVSRVIKEPNYSEIDHIIPRSISHDDSLSNKVLVLMETNQAKNNRIPKEFLTAEEFEKLKQFCKNGFDEQFIDKKSNEFKNKIANLLHDTLTEEDKIDFLARNLNDTRYASKMFLEKLNEYSATHNKQFNVITVRGKFTSLMRKLGKLSPKDRNHFSHHAIDASIIAIVANKYNPWSQSLAFKDPRFEIKDHKVFNAETGEFICKTEELSFNAKKISEIIQNTMTEIVDDDRKIRKTKESILNRIRYSRKLIKDYNIELFKQTIYSWLTDDEGVDRKVERKSIFEIDLSLILEKDKSILMKKSHPQEFNKIYKIFLEYDQKLRDENASSPDDKKKKTTPNAKNIIERYTQDLFREYKEELCNNPEKHEEEARKFLNNENKKALIIGKPKSFSYIRKLKIMSYKLDKDKVSFLPNQNKKGFKESFNWVALLIYKNENDQYKYIPVNAKIYRFANNKKPDFKDESIYLQDELNKQKDANNIPLENKIIDVFYKGTMLINHKEINRDKQLIYISGATSDMIEYKYCVFREKQAKDPQKDVRHREKPYDLLKNYEKIDKSVLG
ncbi:type II CRISPR RNA-guided endonuclease Cas9 [Mycoplasma enhydrae]|uniref:type II CRISPR RNA-guided endonuclease Cas9 n=1 Tax=Mycoplasma enhydrae TaxID=2499220 RepID=UPI0021E9A37B|nr:type II CRISPR RNA-guided endonuclease Cas9 [Mycoplasma enhydrae]MCV3753586.1 type II CRISPR RNA-guided endonuclease Cas9 [Mycoplasma enhydrae]